jgi:hypothetical protein
MLGSRSTIHVLAAVTLAAVLVLAFGWIELALG